MGRCPNCGTSSIFSIKTAQCVWCGKEICSNCVPRWHGAIEIKAVRENIVNGLAYDLPKYTLAGFCSDNCYYQFWERVQNYPISHLIGTDTLGFQNTIISAWNQAILDAAANGYKGAIQQAIGLHTIYHAAIPWWDQSKKTFPHYGPFYNKCRLALAENLEKCGRTQDAAHVFESLQMYDKARALRNQDRHILVKNTTISVNLNALLQQVKDGGIVAVFRCPHCGGKLKVTGNSSVDSLRVCEHCQSEISTMDLADFLKTVL